MDGDRHLPSWLKSAIRAAVVSAALGGGLFALSQALAPSQAHADIVTADADTTAAALPAPVQRPVTLVTTPVVQAVQQVAAPTVTALASAPSTRPVATALASAPSSHPVATTVTTLTQTVSGTVDAVQHVVAPVVGATGTGSSALPPATGGGASMGGGGSAPRAGAVAPASATVTPDATTTGNAASSTPSARPATTTGAAAAASSGTATRFGPALATPGGALVAAVASGATSQGSIAPVAGLPLPDLPGSPAAALDGGTAGSYAGGGSAGGSATGLAAIPASNVFPLVSGGNRVREASAALPAAPIFEHDATPD